MDITITPARALRGEIKVPGDKSISHRAVMLGALSHGETEIENFLCAADCLSTVEVIRGLGVEVLVEGNRVIVKSGGPESLQEPADVLNAGNSGTTMRLMSGILAGCPFYSVLTGDGSLRRRPMGRVIKPLETMGAKIMARNEKTLAPIAIFGGGLCSLNYSSPVSSAQVKSAVLLAGLFTAGETTVVEPYRSRDHTERMLRYLGAKVHIAGNRATVAGRPNLTGKKITVPGDISSAAFFLVAGAITRGADILLPDVGVNPTRTGIIDVLHRMGADITLINKRESNGEPVADIRVRDSHLKGIEISGEIIPHLIDEIPVLAIAAALAEGETVVRDAAELRHKESDRIDAVVKLLRTLGVSVKEMEDGFAVRGGPNLKGAVCESFGDHRMAMTAAVAALNCNGETVIKDVECVNISYPRFFNTLKQITV